MYKIKTVMLSLVLMLPLALSAPIAQADGISSLKNFYAKTNAMRANFYQIVICSQLPARRLRTIVSMWSRVH